MLVSELRARGIDAASLLKRSVAAILFSRWQAYLHIPVYSVMKFFVFGADTFGSWEKTFATFWTWTYFFKIQDAFETNWCTYLFAK